MALRDWAIEWRGQTAVVNVELRGLSGRVVVILQCGVDPPLDSREPAPIYTASFPTLNAALANARRTAQQWGLDVETRRDLLGALEELRPLAVSHGDRFVCHRTEPQPMIDMGLSPISLPGQGQVDSDAVVTLLDLARENNETDFRELAAMVGVPQDQIDALWQGTVRRLGHDALRCATGGGARGGRCG